MEVVAAGAVWLRALAIYVAIGGCTVVVVAFLALLREERAS